MARGRARLNGMAVAGLGLLVVVVLAALAAPLLAPAPPDRLALGESLQPPSAAAMPMAKSKSGKARKTSTVRMTAKSTQPPK